MFDIGFTELLMIGVIALVVLGPERLPHAVRTTSRWLGKIRSMFNQVKDQIEKELDADEIRQQIHNESIMQQLDKGKNDADASLDDIRASLKSMEFDLHSSTEASSDTAADEQAVTKKSTAERIDNQATADDNLTAKPATKDNP
ncbi:Sec-independent protein translocase protein TatB [Sinobacterium norvegicum]|uniref:Sec-independent protein translocase protein TatB n=1 Tax=Sinobacterium norvegicum TaxID=1641715 RepID=A0ABM9AF55_9GAMM|nr:Sec-independent protein translocase protein TatB [Sinobacterium norvegicum]CAH0991835.1 Sec-independent protein translocase protein TatB [Sinobacterium norvegicum]